MLTENQIKRVNQALNETNALIAKELRYQAKFQKQDYLAELRAHVAKLEAMIEEAA